ncbi:RodZ domain-containing protein [Paucisalibacillus sp. EB02]|uniref:helix-turn-helix domain-containing protein n=1 Tax=Paucisalibacillus sp. EB02 TaxID=1347087 RepID=UPI0004B65AFD|nr:RodZ domain-containing protein [Paucisalibacillus sp. EB02]
MGIGARLKEARVEKDISLDTLQDTTKIQKRYLVAIEEENFSVLPGKFYAKAFIKEYAIAVGLDPNQLMEDFKEDIPSPEEDTTTTQYTRIHRSRKDNMPTKSTAVFSFIPTVIVAILIIGIIFLAWWFITKSNETDDPESPTEQTEDREFYRNDNADNNTGAGSDTDETETDSDTEDTTENETTEDEESTEEEPELGITVVEQGIGTKPTSVLELSNVGETLNVEFVATGQQVWLDVQNADGQSFFGGMVSPDEPLTVDLTDEASIYLNVGHAPSLTITINGVELEYPVDPNQRGADHQRLWLNVVESNE